VREKKEGEVEVVPVPGVKGTWGKKWNKPPPISPSRKEGPPSAQRMKKEREKKKGLTIKKKSQEGGHISLPVPKDLGKGNSRLLGLHHRGKGEKRKKGADPHQMTERGPVPEEIKGKFNPTPS